MDIEQSFTYTHAAVDVDLSRLARTIRLITQTGRRPDLLATARQQLQELGGDLTQHFDAETRVESRSGEILGPDLEEFPRLAAYRIALLDAYNQLYNSLAVVEAERPEKLSAAMRRLERAFESFSLIFGGYTELETAFFQQYGTIVFPSFASQ